MTLRQLAEEVIADRAGADPWKAERESRMEINGRTYPVKADLITGAEIKATIAAPRDWVVNQLVGGTDPDPEIGDDEPVSPVGRYRVRNPNTSA
jgi:hypothetical protein